MTLSDFYFEVISLTCITDLFRCNFSYSYTA